MPDISDVPRDGYRYPVPRRQSRFWCSISIEVNLSKCLRVKQSTLAAYTLEGDVVQGR